MFRSLPCLAACVLMISTSASMGAGERYAFLVGVRQYDQTQLNALKYTENDVTRLAAVLARAGYDKDNIVLMTQTIGANETRFLPICKNIRKELDLLLRGVGEGDSLLVAFSGHGVQYEAGGDSYFCPADADLADRSSLVPLGEVYQSLQASKAAVKVLLVDACRNDPQANLARSRAVVDLATLSRQPKLDPPGGIAALFSCSRGEQSFEHPDLKHGIFFHYIIEGLSGKADLDKDQEVSLTELEQYSVKEVLSFARRKLAVAQTPERRGEARGLLTLAKAAVAAPLPTLIEEYRPGQVIENSLGMKLVAIPAGEFLMGSTPAEVDHMQRIDPHFAKRYAIAELPQHPVRITKPFLMGVHEVTKGQFARFVQEQNYQIPRDAKGTGYDQKGRVDNPGPQFTWRNTGYPYEDNQPVVNVSWDDALAFCQWLSAKEKRDYRLPTEAQWEYGCRAGTQTLYSHGDDPEGLVSSLSGNVADGTAKTIFKDLKGISGQDGHVYTAPIGRFRANKFGLCDMHGNVREWCADAFASNFYATSPSEDPLGPEAGAQRVVRGGNFEISAGHCRSASRVGQAPFGRLCSLGFRVVVGQ